MTEQLNDAIFEELNLLFTEDTFWMAKSIEMRLTNKQTDGLKQIIELSQKAEREILQSFQRNYLSKEKYDRDVSYPIPLIKEEREKYWWLINIASLLITCRNDTNQEDIKKAISMLDSNEDFPDYELIIQFKRPSKEKEFFLKRVYVQNKRH